MSPYRVLMFILIVTMTTLAGCAASDGEDQEAAASSEEVSLRISGSGTALPLVEKLAEAYGQEHPEVEFQFEPGTNSGGAITGILEGNLDLAVANRPLSDAEAGEPLEDRAFAQDAVVFVAHRKGEEVAGLSTQEIRDVYGGRLTDWGQLGGSPGQIMVLDRDEDESARKLVLLPLMDGRPVEARTIVLDKASAMVEALESTPDSLGYASLGLLRREQRPELQILALDGVVPSPEAVLQSEYPWYLTFSLVYGEDAPETTREFVEFAAGPEGRRIAEENGYAGI